MGVTIKGNQGTAYVEESTQHFICKRCVPIEKELTSDSGTERMLQEGEIFEVVEGPVPETKESTNRMKGRNLGDGSVGWITLTSMSVVPWSPRYKCNDVTMLTDGLEIVSAANLRKIEPGELLEALDTPVREQSSGLVRVRVRAEKDGVSGFVTVRGAQGSPFLEAVVAEC